LPPLLRRRQPASHYASRWPLMIRHYASAITPLITHIDDIIDADCHIIDAATFRFISPPH
jgi:hypothetical protein